jgi:uncharacterized membrane protein YphA (DoxX/SURF4 family)
MKYILLIGRILYSWIFIKAIVSHFSDKAVESATSAGVPMASIAVPLAGILACIGGLSILFGFKAKIGAWFIVLFLVPVTFAMHDWWNIADPMKRQMQLSNFTKNLALLGSALMISYFGSGPLSVDSKKENS